MLIKFGHQIPPKVAPVSSGEKIHIEGGIVGLEGATSFQLICLADNWPFCFFQPLPDKQISVVVIEPGGWVKDYAPEFADAELATLDIYAKGDALILNVVKIATFEPLEASVDLTRPIVINRHNLVGRQLTLANADRYSSAYFLGA